MTRTANIIVSVVMWCGIAVYVVLAGLYGREKRSGIVVTDVCITVADTAGIKVVSPRKVAQWMGGVPTQNSGVASDRNSAGTSHQNSAGNTPEGRDTNPGPAENSAFVGRPAARTDTRAIEKHIAGQPGVRRASVWVDLDGTLNVRVEQRRPAMRVHTSNGYRFWVTDDGCIVSDKGEFTAYVPVVTGNVPFPFSPSVSGSYYELLAANRADFIERFTAIETERRNLASERQSKRAELRTVRAGGPKRWWNKARKKRFNEEKPIKIAEIEAGIKKIDAAMAVLAQNKRTLGQKEIFSHQSHLFLLKLANFVRESLGSSTFWGAEVVQIDVNGGLTRGGAGWQEPEIELITRTGDHVVKLGELDGDEGRRLENLYLFYLDGLRHEGWHEFRTIDIRYKDQIICKR